MNENPNVQDDTPPPYDLVGDVHGCIDELRELLGRLGYQERPSGGVRHPGGRTLVFLGDLGDRGPDAFAVWKLVLASLESGVARLVPGNHDAKLVRFLEGREPERSGGFDRTVEQWQALPVAERQRLGPLIERTIKDLPPYLILDHGRLVAVHAGLEEEMIGLVDRRISLFARWGEKTGEHSPEGLPIRRDWAGDYRGPALIVYGHTPTPEPRFRNNTINIDQGCAFGGSLTALRYPEREIVSVPAQRVYAEPDMAGRVWDAELRPLAKLAGDY